MSRATNKQPTSRPNTMTARCKTKRNDNMACIVLLVPPPLVDVDGIAAFLAVQPRAALGLPATWEEQK